MSFYHQNLTCIQKRFADLVPFLEESDSYSDFKVSTSKSGEPTLQIDGNWIHSTYRPLVEAEKIVAQQVRGNESTLLFYGLGLGYLPCALVNFLENRSTTQLQNWENLRLNYPTIFIIEPNLSLLKSALIMMDLSSLLNYPNLILLTRCSPQTVLSSITLYGNPNFSILTTPALRTNFRGEPQRKLFFSGVDSLLKKYQNSWEVNFNTHKKFKSLWQNNIFNSIKRIQDGKKRVYPVSNLFGMARGLDALVIAAGPSLNGGLEVIRQFKREQRGPIIAVDTALLFLQKNKILPDFVVVSDCQYWNSRLLDRIYLDSVRVLTELTVHPALFSKNPVAFYLYSSRIPIYRGVESLVSPFGEIGTGGSVATSAWDFARLLGCQRIFTVGLDLSYPNLQTHCFPSRFEESIQGANTKLQPLDNFNIGIVYGKITQEETRAKLQCSVRSDHRMVIYRNWFEHQIERYPGFYFTLGDRGIQIEGIISISHLPLKSTSSPLSNFFKDLSKTEQETSQIHFPINLSKLLLTALEGAIKRLEEDSFRFTGKILLNDPLATYLIFENYSTYINSNPDKRKRLLQASYELLLLFFSK